MLALQQRILCRRRLVWPWVVFLCFCWPFNAWSFNGDASYAEYITQTAKRYDLPIKLVDSVIRHESNYRVDVISPKGAVGLMQIMPGTAKFLGVRDIYDPYDNIDAGCRYLSYLLGMFGGDVEKALAAYNAGPGAVMRHNGIPPFKETRRYVEKVLKSMSDNILYRPKNVITDDIKFSDFIVYKKDDSTMIIQPGKVMLLNLSGFNRNVAY